MAIDLVISLLSCFIYQSVACPAGYTLCALETDINNYCSVSGTIAYGKVDDWAYKENTATIDCNDATFGDPAPTINTKRCCCYVLFCSNYIYFKIH